MANRTPNSPIEKHIQTVLVSVITAAILWVGLNVADLKTNLYTLQASVTRLEAKASTTEGDHYVLTDLQRRIEKLEAKR